MSGFERFKEAISPAARGALGRAHEKQKAEGRDSNVGKFLLGLTDERPSGVVVETDAFIVELFLRFGEIFQSVQVLDDIEQYLKRFPPKVSRSRYLAYHVHSYLEEMYLLQQRLEALLNKYERWYKPSASKSEESNTIKAAQETLCTSFSGIIQARGAHVHEQRFSDAELDRLAGWEALADGAVSPSEKWIRLHYDNQIKRTRTRWIDQIKTNNRNTKIVLDKMFQTLFELTFSEDCRVIIPKRYSQSRDRSASLRSPHP